MGYLIRLKNLALATFDKFRHELPNRHRLTAQHLSPVLGLIASFLLVRQLWERLVFEFSSPSGHDSPVYWAVGRGITNGLAPWKDLFDNKPPGIHLVAALSYHLTGATDFAQALQALAILIIAFTPCLASFLDWRMLRSVTIARITFSLLSGLLLALYASARCDELQTEYFGAGAGCLYLLTAYYAGPINPRWRFFTLSVCLALSVGFKEPFLLVLMAAALVKSTSFREFAQDFIFPAFGALFLGVSCFVLLGWLDAYVSIYLHVIFNYRLFIDELPSPLWKRGLEVMMVMHDLGRFSLVLLLLLALACISIPLHTLMINGQCKSTDSGISIVLPRGQLLPCARAVLCLIVGVYLTVLAVEMGGYRFPHYFIFAVPFYQSILIRFSRDIIGARIEATQILGTFLIGCILLSSFTLTGPDYRSAAKIMRGWRTPGQNTAALIDEVLEDCGLERYLSIGFVGAQPYAFTRHSPLGPLFLQWRPWLNFPLFRTSFLQNLSTARLISVNTSEFAILGDLEQKVRTELSSNFQEQPWQCYKGRRHPMPPFKVFYRKN